MIVKCVGEFLVAISEIYGEKLNLFCENFMKCQETIKTLGSGNKGDFNYSYSKKCFERNILTVSK